MGVTSFAFIIFCIITVFVFYMLPYRMRWVWLLAMNLLFYVSAGVLQVVFIVMAACISWSGSWLITRNYQKEEIYFQNTEGLTKERKKEVKLLNGRKRKGILFCVLLLVLGQLAVVKYNGIFLHNGSLFCFFGNSVQGIVVPLGISFYSLFSIGYCIDVYRGQYTAEKSLLKYFTVVTFFPCISQGPFERYGHLSEQIFADKKFDGQQVVFGAELMLWGFFKKMVIADNLSPFVTEVFQPGSGGGYGGLFVIAAAFCYSIQIYADFSGYVDIVSGLGRMLGIALVQNFNAPYFSKSVPEFWRNWHMSLGSWFKDYVFYSVLRSSWCQFLVKKAGKVFSRKVSMNIVTSVALFINWFLIGLWHGLEWKYILFDLYYGGIMILDIWLKPIYRTGNCSAFFYRVFQVGRTFLVVCFAYILLCAGNVSEFIFHLKEIIFYPNPKRFFSYELFAMGISRSKAVMLLFAVAVLVLVDILHVKGHNIRCEVAKKNIVLRWLLLVGIIYAVILFGAYGPEYDVSTFIYQAF